MKLINIQNLKFENAYFDKFCSHKQVNHKCAGVYFIKEDGVITYIGMSKSNVHKALYRHFQVWNDNRNRYMPKEVFPPYERTTYVDTRHTKKYEVSIINCNNPYHAAILEKIYIQKHQPRDNKEKYEIFKEERLSARIVQEIDNNYYLHTQPTAHIPF